MASNLRTLQEYCEILGVSPASDEEEIKLAYAFRKHDARSGGEVTEAELKEAFQALTNPVKREALQSRPRAATGAVAAACAARPPAQRSPVNAVALLGGLLLVLVAVLGLLVWPTYRHHFRQFGAEDRLIDETTGKPYGTVLEVSANYTFPNGKVGEAYRVRLELEGREVWFPASDIKYTCVKP